MKRNRIFAALVVLVTVVCALTYTSVREPTSLLNFRTSHSEFQKSKKLDVARDGLDTLRISGSGQLREIAFVAGMKETGAKPSDIYVIDLSGDAQLYTDGRPFGWFNWSISEKGIEGVYSKRLTPSAFKENYVCMMRRLFYPNPSTTRLETEEQMVGRLGYHYQKFAVNRKHIYPPETIDQFLHFVNELPEGAWLHFHCYAGCSRTTSMMIIYDIIKNGDKVSLEAIMDRHWALGGSNMKDTKPWFFGSWKTELLQMRKAMLSDFYRYRNDPDAFGKISWSEWIAKNGTAKEPGN